MLPSLPSNGWTDEPLLLRRRRLHLQTVGILVLLPSDEEETAGTRRKEREKKDEENRALKEAKLHAEKELSSRGNTLRSVVGDLRITIYIRRGAIAKKIEGSCGQVKK